MTVKIPVPIPETVAKFSKRDSARLRNYLLSGIAHMTSEDAALVLGKLFGPQEPTPARREDHYLYVRPSDVDHDYIWYFTSTAVFVEMKAVLRGLREQRNGNVKTIRSMSGMSGMSIMCEKHEDRPHFSMPHTLGELVIIFGHQRFTQVRRYDDVHMLVLEPNDNSCRFEKTFTSEAEMRAASKQARAIADLRDGPRGGGGSSAGSHTMYVMLTMPYSAEEMRKLFPDYTEIGVVQALGKYYKSE
jgi:hypothetical protein